MGTFVQFPNGAWFNVDEIEMVRVHLHYDYQKYIYEDKPVIRVKMKSIIQPLEGYKGFVPFDMQASPEYGSFDEAKKALDDLMEQINRKVR